MRALVFLLVLANLLVFAWGQGYFGTPASPDASRVAQQISPERLRIVARGEPPAPASPPVAPPPPPDACLAWRGLIAAEADRLAKLVGERAPGAKLARTAEATTAKAWWVFIPPQANKAEVERKVAELRKLEITDFFVVQEAGANRLAISLGVFSTEASAKAYLENLRGQGIKLARLGPKGGVEQHVAVEVRGPKAEVAALRDVLGERAAVECSAAENLEAKAAATAAAVNSSVKP